MDEYSGKKKNGKNFIFNEIIMLYCELQKKTPTNFKTRNTTPYYLSFFSMSNMIICLIFNQKNFFLLARQTHR